MKKILSFLFCIILILALVSPTYATVNTESLKVNSGACILAENSTGKIIYEKNSKEKMYPASTTKVMTALIALENCKTTDVATVSRNAVKSISADYATVYLNEGEELTIEQLLNILLIPSGNIVGNILAEYISGSFDAFVNLMNTRAAELGCVNTHFTNTYGLHDDNHYSCAYDLYLIAREAMKYDVFRSIVAKTSYHLGPTNMYSKDDRNFFTTNDLIKPNSSSRADNYYYANAIGIKTGYTSQAKDCLIAAASKDGLEFITVILGGGKTSQGLNERYLDTKKLFNFAYNNYFLRNVREQNSVVDTIEIKNATNDTKNLDILSQNKITVLVDKDEQYITINPNINLNDNLKAPIFEGDVVGSVTYMVGGINYESNLIASHNVEESYFMYIVIGIGIGLFIIVILVVKSLLKKRKKKNYRVNKYRI